MIIELSGDAPLRADLGKRKIRGQAVPWGVDATVSTGQKVRFEAGSVDLDGTPVVLHHDETQPIGKVIDSTSNDAGLDVVASISQVSGGDEALVLAADGVVTGWSVGVEPTEFTEDDQGVMVVTASLARHLALVTTPAFPTARVTEVAAQAAYQESEKAKQERRTTVDAPAPPAKSKKKEPAVSDDTTTEAPAVVNAAAGAFTTEARLPGVGEYLHAQLHQGNAPERFAAMQAAVQAAAPDTILSDVPGLIPVPLLNTVFNRFHDTRPWFDALSKGTQAVEGSGFRMPIISDPLSDGSAVAELADASDTLGVTDVAFTWATVKRAFEVSAETIIRSSPSVLDVLAQQLVASYRRGCEAYIKTAVEAATYPTAIAVAAGGTDLVKQLHVAASAIYMDTGGMPDVWLVSNTVWAQIGGYSAADGRQLFPYLSPMNTAGTSGGVTDFTLNPLGLKVAVSHLASSTSSFLFNSNAIPTWESQRVDYSIYAPTVLSYQAGYIGHVTAKPLLTGATTNAGRKLTHA
jgi:hypothetical protein